MTKLRQYFYHVRSTFWFVPGLIILGAIALAIGMIEAGALVDQKMLARWPLLSGAGAAGSRGLLAAIGEFLIDGTPVAFALGTNCWTRRMSADSARLAWSAGNGRWTRTWRLVFGN